jgi:hypothetical protein
MSNIVPLRDSLHNLDLYRLDKAMQSTEVVHRTLDPESHLDVRFDMRFNATLPRVA